MLMPYFPLLKFFMHFSPILFFPLLSSNFRSSDIVCVDQCCLLFLKCKVEPPHPCLPSFHQCLQNAAFHSPAFLLCVALAFQLSCLNANGLGMGTASAADNLSSNSTSPPLCHAMHKCFSVSCLAALFPSFPQWLFGCDTPLTNNVSAKRKGGYNSPAPAQRVHVGVHASLGAGMLLASCWWHLRRWPAALHSLHSWPQLVQLTKLPVVQNVTVLNEGSDDLD